MQTKWSNRSQRKALLHRIIGVLLLLALWQLAALFFPPLVVPPPRQVALRLWEIINSPGFPSVIFTTLVRLLAGLAIGVTIGTLLGLLLASAQRQRKFFIPLSACSSLFRRCAGLLWLLSGSALTANPVSLLLQPPDIPIMVINLSGGVRNIDPQLLQMAQLYHFGHRKTLRHIILPSVYPCFRMALEIIIGSGWKLVVMGEVLTTSTGIGGAITTARLNIEPDAIIAWAVLLTAFCFLTEKILKTLLCRKGVTPC